jgi:hypothetical protein
MPWLEDQICCDLYFSFFFWFIIYQRKWEDRIHQSRDSLLEVDQTISNCLNFYCGKFCFPSISVIGVRILSLVVKLTRLNGARSRLRLMKLLCRTTPLPLLLKVRFENSPDNGLCCFCFAGWNKIDIFIKGIRSKESVNFRKWFLMQWIAFSSFILSPGFGFCSTLYWFNFLYKISLKIKFMSDLVQLGSLLQCWNVLDLRCDVKKGLTGSFFLRSWGHKEASGQTCGA